MDLSDIHAPRFCTNEQPLLKRRFTTYVHTITALRFIASIWHFVLQKYKKRENFDLNFFHLLYHQDDVLIRS